MSHKQSSTRPPKKKTRTHRYAFGKHRGSRATWIACTANSRALRWWGVTVCWLTAFWSVVSTHAAKKQKYDFVWLWLHIATMPLHQEGSQTYDPHRLQQKSRLDRPHAPGIARSESSTNTAGLLPLGDSLYHPFMVISCWVKFIIGFTPLLGFLWLINHSIIKNTDD